MKGVYIHIPFCRKKCKYCDFVSYTGLEALAGSYLDAVEREAAEYRGEKINTVFIGGGTPSILSPEHIMRITGICRNMFDISDTCEFTMEVNPGTLDAGRTEAMRAGGVNRVSVGVQSFNDAELKAIGRIHDAETAYNTICGLKESGFSNISVDLMTALPGQTMKSLENTLKTAVSLPIEHISAYSLIVEDGTPLEREYSRGEITLPDDGTDREMYAYTVDFLKENGFFQYEISNFARKGFECRHNIKYWTGEEYIGLGAAAHSYIGNKRFFNVSDVEAYIDGGAKTIIRLGEKDKISEFIITGLRMTEGISVSEFKERFKADLFGLFKEQTDKFIRLGLMTYDGSRLALTRRGIDVSNSILCEFV